MPLGQIIPALLLCDGVSAPSPSPGVPHHSIELDELSTSSPRSRARATTHLVIFDVCPEPPFYTRQCRLMGWCKCGPPYGCALVHFTSPHHLVTFYASESLTGDILPTGRGQPVRPTGVHWRPFTHRSKRVWALGVVFPSDNSCHRNRRSNRQASLFSMFAICTDLGVECSF